MIDIYHGQHNPCSFCTEKEIQEEVLVSEQNGCLEFAFCGNDTRLFLRETSVDCLAPYQGKDAADRTLPENMISSVSQKREICQQTDDEMKRTGKKQAQLQMKGLSTKKWSGKTYFEEAIQKIRLLEYENEVAEALRNRKLWQQFQHELAQDRKRDLLKSSGPEWWQEPSRKQICLAMGLADVIKADYEEDVTGRTRQWLLDIGVTTRLKPRQVRICMRSSLLNPVDFLLEIHALVVESQDRTVKRRGDLERPFSVNERILLSAVCVLHLPTLLTMLHYVLSPPKPYTEPRQIQELLFGDLEDERIRYSTPYMEPLPFRSKKQFHDWAVDKVYTALLPSLVVDEQHGVDLSNIQHQYEQRDRTSTGQREMSAISSSSSVAWLISRCISKRKSLSTFSYYESDSDSRKIFRRSTINKISLAIKGSKIPFRILQPGDSHSIVQDGGRASVNKPQMKSHKDGSRPTSMTLPTVVEFVPPHVRSPCETVVSHLRSISYQDTVKSVVSQTASKLALVAFKNKLVSDEIENESNYTSKSEDNKEGTCLFKEEQFLQTVAQPQVKLTDINNELEGLEEVWKELKTLPIEKQLKRAVKVLAQVGDPLAQLPRIHLLPSLQRWKEMRNGKRLLSKKRKEELLKMSRNMWKMAPITCVNQGPKLKCSKKEERKLTWDRKKWLEAEVKKETKSYIARLRQEKVDNARTYFPTMLNHYDYGSKLNRRFRDVFFTYLPAREADTFVYRPWEPSASM